jgi:hypothetical protein
MKNKRTKEFKKLFVQLPIQVQQEVRDVYNLFSKEPYHRSLQFKRIDQCDPIYSVRIGRKYRAVGWYEGGVIRWYWVGSYEDYNHL